MGSESDGVADGEADCVSRGCSGGGLINFFRLGDWGGEGAGHSWSSGGDMPKRGTNSIDRIKVDRRSGLLLPYLFQRGDTWLYIVNLNNLTWK